MIDNAVRADPAFESSSVCHNYCETDRVNPSIYAADTGILSLTSINIFVSLALFLSFSHAPSRPFILYSHSHSLSFSLASFFPPTLFSAYSQPSYSDLVSFLSCTAKHLHDHSAASTLRSLICLINTVTTRFNGDNCGLLQLIKL